MRQQQRRQPQTQEQRKQSKRKSGGHRNKSKDLMFSSNTALDPKKNLKQRKETVENRMSHQY